MTSQILKAIPFFQIANGDERGFKNQEKQWIKRRLSGQLRNLLGLKENIDTNTAF